MPRYFFHVDDGQGARRPASPDRDGTDLPSPQAAREEAQALLGLLRPRLAARLGVTTPPERDPGLEVWRACDADDKERWPAYFSWLAEQIARYHEAIAVSVAVNQAPSGVDHR